MLSIQILIFLIFENEQKINFNCPVYPLEVSPVFPVKHFSARSRITSPFKLIAHNISTCHILIIPY